VLSAATQSAKTPHATSAASRPPATRPTRIDRAQVLCQ
jgi:hypothetical protein